MCEARHDLPRCWQGRPRARARLPSGSGLAVTDYLVVVGYSRRSLVGQSETNSVAMRISGTDAISAGETGLDRTVKGPKWMYEIANAKVIDTNSHAVLAEAHAPGIKAYGVARSRTSYQWRTLAESGQELMAAATVVPIAS